MIRDTAELLQEMQGLCAEWGERLVLHPTEPDGAALLYALFLNERYTATHPHPRYEVAYGPYGRYFHTDLWERFGQLAACSYSNFQIMLVVAYEFGFTGTPQELDRDEVAIRYVTDLLNKRLLRLARKDDGVATLEELLDGYNTGNPRDRIVPAAYIKRGQRHYADALEILATRAG